jgi:hypothetical protein
MNSDHAYFAVLCALAASGQLTRAEQAELHAHSRQCVLCRDRLVEMHQLNVQLFLAQAPKRGDRKPPQGMGGRFALRAISEGIPLRTPSAGISLHALGLVTVVLLALLLVAQTLKDGSSTKSAREIDGADSSYASRPVLEDQSLSPGVLKDRPGGQVLVGRLLHRQREWRSGHGTPSLVSLTSGTGRQFLPGPAPSRSHRFVFVPNSGDFEIQAHSFSTTTLRPYIVRVLAQPYLVTTLTSDTSTEIIRTGVLDLAGCDHGAFAPTCFRSNLAAPHSATRSFHGSLDLDAYKPTLIGFKTNVAAFQLIQNTAP